MYVKADRLLPQALSTVFHEVGHGLHRNLNLGQWREIPSETHIEIMTHRAFKEAIAMAFEAANFRALGEHTGVETSHLSADWYISDSRVASIVNSVAALHNTENGSEVYNRGRLLIWTAVLYDPDLSHLRSEFESNGRLSGGSLYEVFLKFVNMPGADVHFPTSQSVTPDGDFEADGAGHPGTQYRRGQGKRGFRVPGTQRGRTTTPLSCRKDGRRQIPAVH